MLDYRAPLDQVLLAFKFGGREYLGEPLAHFCHDHLRDELRQSGPHQLVVPVPLAFRRRWQRGFNQSLILARAFSRRLAIPCRSLLKRRPRPPQSRLPLSERRSNVRGTFSLRQAPRGERVLLIDDVVTSGATLSEAARCLRRGGAAEVTALALARTPDSHFHGSSPAIDNRSLLPPQLRRIVSRSPSQSS